MSELLESVMRWFENPENVKKFEKDLEHKEFLKKKYMDYISKLKVEERKSLLRKIMNKYESDEYIKREYRIGYQPRESLYDPAIDWMIEYGKEYEDEDYKDCVFPIKSYISDNITLTLIYGQGTKVIFDILDEREKNI